MTPLNLKPQESRDKGKGYLCLAETYIKCTTIKEKKKENIISNLIMQMDH